MRSLPVIESIWDEGGPFIGERKPTTRVLIQEPWPDLDGENARDFLRETSHSAYIGNHGHPKTPIRWFQKADNAQPMRELPNITEVQVDESVDQDAASFSITLNNQWMHANGAVPANAVSAGQPGHFTPNHGTSAGAARWGHAPNDWDDYLVPNAVIRIYTGFGGDGGTVQEQVANGNLAIYGTYLVDRVNIDSSGRLGIEGRNMMKLLIDQHLFPPLVPNGKYPLTYDRYAYRDVPIRNANKMVTIDATGDVEPGEKRCVYMDSTEDRWYGPGASIYGHRGSHSVDGDPFSYALSVGNSGPDRPFATNWIEYECGEDMNAIFVHPWAGGYTMYVSIIENLAWVNHHDPPEDDNGVVPYDASILFATQKPAVDTGANVPYVARFHVPHEQARTYILPRVYNAQRVRISFRNLVNSGLGVWKFRSGVREFKILGASADTASMGGVVAGETETEIEAYIQAVGYRNVEGDLNSQGYLTVGCHGDQDAFGDARVLKYSGGNDHTFGDHLDVPTAIRFTKSGDGYYVLTSGGTIRCYGDAPYFGDPFSNNGFTASNEPNDGHAWDMALTHTGEGYWISSSNGLIFNYGDAPPYHQFDTAGTLGAGGAQTGLIGSIDAHPSAYGLWGLRNDGKVLLRGACEGFGWPPDDGPNALRYDYFDTQADPNNAFIGRSEIASCIRGTQTGKGYWILTTKGRVHVFGDAKDHGQLHDLADHPDNVFTQSYWELAPGPGDRGYLLFHASGRVDRLGDIINFGGPVPGQFATQRSDGNYRDYSDIIRDLVLWSGFFLHQQHDKNERPSVFGEIESTGAFAKDRLPDEMFDKKPVIDAINAIKEVVGYQVRCNREGGFVFSSPNWWHIGNFDDDGDHVPIIPEIDERRQLVSYSMSTEDTAVRSSITISSYDPYADAEGTVTTKYTPPSARRLRGMLKPAMWVNGYFMDPSEQQTMAELIGLHITFQERIGQVSCVANPVIEIDDQVRIYERVTEETNIHYVRGIQFNHNLETGSYMMTLTTHWLSSGEGTETIVGGPDFAASPELQAKIDDQTFGKFRRERAGLQ